MTMTPILNRRYANESNIPEEIMESLELKTLWKETTDLTWM